MDSRHRVSPDGFVRDLPDGFQAQLLLHNGREEPLDIGAVGGCITDHKHQGAVTTAPVFPMHTKSIMQSVTN